jgi:hypothetical protein
LIGGHNCRVIRHSNNYRDGGLANLQARRDDEDDLLLQDDSVIYYGDQGSLRSPGDGVFTLMNDAETSFSRLQLGGTTSSFPSLKRNGAALQAQLADDSAPADFVARDHYGFSAGGVETIRMGGSAGRLLLQSAGLITWTPSIPSDTPDVVLTRETIGGLRIAGNVGLTANGSLNMNRRVLVRNSGSADTVDVGEAFSVFTNESTPSRQDFNLPTAVAGLTYSFVVKHANGVRVIANTGDTIRWAATVSGAAGRIDSTTIGDAVTLVAINDTEWVVTAIVGAGWTVT